MTNESTDQLKIQKPTAKNMPNYYCVKFVLKDNPKQVRFGIQESYSREAKSAWVKDKALMIEDAVSGEMHRVLIDLFNVIPMKVEMNYNIDPKTSLPINNEYDKFVNEAYKQAIKADKKAGAGLKVGRMFVLPVGDGGAYYVVTKVGKTNCIVGWRGFSPDRWVDRMLGYGGSFPRRMIEPECR